VVKHAAVAGTAECLGGVGEQAAAALSAITGKEARNVFLGYLQRGGSPTSFDRLLSLCFGAAACDHEVRLLHPVAREKWIVRQTAVGEAISRRKSPNADSRWTSSRNWCA
jgi:6-phosphofructokinase